MDVNNYKLSLKEFKWLNEPEKWKISMNNTILEVTTDKSTDFWQGTYYNFHFNSGHVYGVELNGDFTFSACIEANFIELYDQAGLMLYADEKHWLKTGIEYNDGQPMIASVLTNGTSDWATGIFPGDANKFYLRITRKGKVAVVKYSTDNLTWILLRLCEVPGGPCIVGPMCCTPKRGGLNVKFSNMTLCEPKEDILHSN